MLTSSWAVYAVSYRDRFRKMDDALTYLARRSPSLAHYEPPPAQPPAGGWRLEGPVPQALVVHGSSFVAVPQAAADLFVDVLYPAGCRTILITGGVGRETPLLWKELHQRGMTSLFSREPWEPDTPPNAVILPMQGSEMKPVLDHVDLEMPPDELRRHCTEADVFLEIICARCFERGLKLRVGGNPMVTHTARLPVAAKDDACIYIETASTHTGTNVEYSRTSLRLLLGEEAAAATSRVVVVQQPQLHLRTTLTWEKQTGAAPLAWTLQPTEAAVGRPLSEMRTYALGEYRRIPAYATADKDFCVLPADWAATGALHASLLEAEAQ